MSLNDILAEPATEVPTRTPENANSKGPYKSWRKKFRKMKLRFDRAMDESNTYYKDEERLTSIARRLQEQNDQLLEILLDLNESTKLPDNLRIDLTTPPLPGEAGSPPPIADATPEQLESLQGLREAMESGNFDPIFYADTEARLRSTLRRPGPRRLDDLDTIPHTPYPTTHLPDDLTTNHPPGYLTTDHEEEYLAALDAALADPAVYDPHDASGRPIRALDHPALTDKDLQLRNPVSVTNWLRKHQPDVFLQDKAHDAGSEKGGGATRAGASHRAGGGKKGSAAAAAAMAQAAAAPKTEQELLDEEIGFVPEAGSGSGKGRRTRDDEPYRPKGGSSRPAKRKREDGEKGARKKVARGTNAGGGTPS